MMLNRPPVTPCAASASPTTACGTLSKAADTSRYSSACGHPLSLAADADRIVVLEGGRAVQTGTHDELLAAEGMYARLWALQSGADRPGANGVDRR